MTRTVEAVAADLARLTARDFEWEPGADGPERLHSLCDELHVAGSLHDAAPVLFQLVERLSDTDLGSPGPIVHTLEAMPGYECYLRESVHRRATLLTLWMVNRIANARRPDWADWVELLKAVAQDNRAPSSVREEANHFLVVQREA